MGAVPGRTVQHYLKMQVLAVVLGRIDRFSKLAVFEADHLMVVVPGEAGQPCVEV